MQRDRERSRRENKYSTETKGCGIVPLRNCNRPKVIREIQKNLLCVGKRKAVITKKNVKSKCWCSESGLAPNAKHVINCCRKVNGEINSRHDIIVNILLNNILIQRIDLQRADVGRSKGGEEFQRRNHGRDRTPAVRRVEGQRPSRWSEAEA